MDTLNVNYLTIHSPRTFDKLWQVTATYFLSHLPDLPYISLATNLKPFHIYFGLKMLVYILHSVNN